MDRLGRLTLLVLIIGSGCLFADSTTVSRDVAYRRILDYLKTSQVPEAFVSRAYNSRDVKYKRAVISRFKKPIEQQPYLQYKKIFITRGRIRAGVSFYQSHRSMIDSISTLFGVDPLVLTGLVGIESNYGHFHAEFSVFNALYSVILGLPSRSDWAIRELSEFLIFCYDNNMDPQAVRGSYAGAFGYGQFIPSSFNKYAIDIDGDGIRNHLQWPDVLGSIANYLIKNGYPPGSTDFSTNSGVYRALYTYNHSDNYVRAVLDLRTAIQTKLK